MSNLEVPARTVSFQGTRLRLAYFGLWLFIVVYFSRPSDWIPGGHLLPLAKITAAIAVAGFVAGILTSRGAMKHWPAEMWLLLVLFAHLCFTIPFAIWKGGSFGVVLGDFWKVVLMTLVLAISVNTTERLRRLVFSQTLCLVFVGMFSVMQEGSSRYAGRLAGAVGGIFGNPNDLAFTLAIGLPFCLALALASKQGLMKLAWLAGAGFACGAILLSYSRSGFLALMAAVLAVIWQFGIRDRRPYVIALAVLLALVFLLVGGPADYGDRIFSIFDRSLDERGSMDAREQLFWRGVEVTRQNPVFGVGPGNFPVVSGVWRGTHNTYVQLSSEAGIPALLLFIAILIFAFRNLRRAERIAPQHRELLLLVRGIRCSLVVLVIGAFFGNAAYHFFPYILVGYTSAAYAIARQSGAGEFTAKVTSEHTLPQGTQGRGPAAGRPAATFAYPAVQGRTAAGHFARR